MQHISQYRLLAFAVGDLLVDCEVLGIPKDLQGSARLVVKDKRPPIPWNGVQSTGDTYLTTYGERRDSGYDPGVHVISSGVASI